MPNEIQINFSSPANKTALAFLGITEPEQATSYTLKEVNIMSLGTHPDFVEYLWKMSREVHPNCACTINQRSYPILVHPVSGIIFALAGGTNTLAFRLPEP